LSRVNRGRRRFRIRVNRSVGTSAFPKSQNPISRSGENEMFKRGLFFAYGTLSYLIFLGTFLYAVCFIGNFGVPRTLDGAASGPLWVSLAIDAGLLALFAVQHS